MRTKFSLDSIEIWAAVVIAFGLCAVMYYRLFFGVSVGDESFYVTMALLPALGGQWYFHEMLFQQTASMLYAPILHLYKYLFGTTAVILFVRHLHFLLSLLVAYNVFLVLKSINRTSVAVLLSSLFVVFVPHGVQSLSYNTMGFLFFALASSLSIRAYSDCRRSLAGWAGVFWILCSFSYPTLSLAFFVALIGALWISRGDKNHWQNFFKPFLLVAISVSLPLLAWLVYLGVENILASIRFSGAYSSVGLWKVPFTLNLLSQHFPYPIGVGAWILICIFVGHRVEAALVYLLAGFLAAFAAFSVRYESQPFQVLMGVFSFFVFVIFIGRRFQFKGADRAMVWLAIFPAIVGSITACLTSRATLYVMCVTGVVGSIFLIAMVVGRNRVIGLIVAALLTVLATSGIWNNFYEDDAFSKLHYTFDSGPLKGLTTFEEKGQFIDAIQSDLQKFGISGKRILFHDLFLVGYLMADNIPSGPTLYFGPAVFFADIRRLYVELFRDPKWLPDVVVELAYFPVNTKTRWPYSLPNEPGGFNRFFAESGQYESLVERSTHKILVRKIN